MLDSLSGKISNETYAMSIRPIKILGSPMSWRLYGRSNECLYPNITHQTRLLKRLHLHSMRSKTKYENWRNRGHDRCHQLVERA
jgi:hypothetical protein